MAEQREEQGDPASIRQDLEELEQQAAPAGPLHRAVERHLLLAYLDPVQQSSVRTRGWFVVDWPKQVLALKIQTRRVPTVDAYQLPPPRLAPDPVPAKSPDPEAQYWLGASWSELVLSPRPRPVYLCSFDVRSAHRALDAPLIFHRMSGTPVGLARLVCEAIRHGELERLLAASEAVRIAELLNKPLEVPAARA